MGGSEDRERMPDDRKRVAETAGRVTRAEDLAIKFIDTLAAQPDLDDRFVMNVAAAFFEGVTVSLGGCGKDPARTHIARSYGLFRLFRINTQEDGLGCPHCLLTHILHSLHGADKSGEELILALLRVLDQQAARAVDGQAGPVDQLPLVLDLPKHLVAAAMNQGLEADAGENQNALPTSETLQ